MKCRRLPSFAMSIEALEIRDLKSVHSVTQCALAPIDDSRVDPFQSAQFGDLARCKFGRRSVPVLQSE